jgi:Spy/CpxP family protein refolding chaperone
VESIVAGFDFSEVFMRRHVLPALLAFTFAMASHASAQTPAAPPARDPARMQAMLFEGITLTSTQQTQVDSISAKYRAQYPQMTPGSPPTEADRATFRALAQEQQTAIRAALTTDQQPIFDRNVAKLRERMRARMQSGPPPAQ